MGTRENLAIDTRVAQRLVDRPRDGACPSLDIEAIAGAVIVVSTTGHVLDLNRRAADILGYEREELHGRPVEDVLRCTSPGGDTPHDFAAQLGVEYVRGGRAVIIHRSGREQPIEVMLSPDLAESAIIAVFQVSARDAHSMLLRDEDVTAIGHDLRGPLSVIALEVSMLEERLPVADRPEVRQSLTRIARNLTFLDHMLHDLLDLSSLDASCLQVARERLELSGLVADVVDRIVASRDRSRVLVETHGPVAVDADGRRIERVVSNLVQNALKYAPKGSAICVRVQRRASQARVSVQDEGPGLAPDAATRVFDRFNRAAGTRHRESTGLGLYVSRKIVEAHDGRMAVDSVIGKGSMFYFDLPVVP